MVQIPPYRALIQSTSAQKCTRSGRSHSTDCSSELSHQCRGLSSSAVNQVGGLPAGGELGDVATGKGVQAENCGWYWPVLCAEGDEFRSGVLPEKARWECAFAKWLRFWKRRHGPA